MDTFGYSPRHPRRAQVANYNLDNPALDFILDELDPQPSSRRSYNRPHQHQHQHQRRDPSQPMPPPPAPLPAGGVLRRFLCRFCGYVATSAGNRDKHERVHTGEKTIQCGYCDYATADTSNYNRHLRRKHGVEPEGSGLLPPGVIAGPELRVGGGPDNSGEEAGIQCPYCPYATADVDDFDRHVRIRHNGEEELACPECNYRSYFRSNMTRHYRVKHLGNIAPSRRGRPTRQASLNSPMPSFTPHVRPTISSGAAPLQPTNSAPATSTNHTTPSASFPPNLAYSIRDQDQCVLCRYQTTIRSNLYRHYRLVHKAEDREDIIRIVESAQAIRMSAHCGQQHANKGNQHKYDVKLFTDDEDQNAFLLEQIDQSELSQVSDDTSKVFEDQRAQMTVILKAEAACTSGELRNGN